MRKLFFYPKLAASNIKNNRSLYVPFLITSTLSAAMYYIIYSLSVSESLGATYGGQNIKTIMAMAMIVAVLFFTVFLFYTQSFLIKRRQKEFGLYSVLGLEKKHICITLFFETLYTALVSIVGGVLVGTLLSKLIYLALLKLLQFQTGMEFEFSPKAVQSTAVIFGCIFVLLFINSVRSVLKQNAVQLLTGSNAGEKEPKTKWIMAILGAVSLGAGYWIALVTESPLEAIGKFVLAVILVMIGTYFLFSAGSIALLKSLRKNKKYYYKTNHFISVSGMMYRMKQNAVGLGNICILCTAVLVMISTTVSLYGGMEDLLRTRFPRNISVSTVSEADTRIAPEINATVDSVLKKKQIPTENVIQTAEYSIMSMQDGNTFRGHPQGEYSAGSITTLHCILLSDYNRMTGSKQTLQKDEVLLYVLSGEFASDTMDFGDFQLHVKKQLDEYAMASRNLAYMVHTFYVVVPDRAMVDTLYHTLGGTEKLCPGSYEYSFDTSVPAEKQVELFGSLKKAFADKAYREDLVFESAEESRQSFFSLYGGLLFIGIFLGLIFLMATVLIIYYKQVSEGYEDKARYAILDKVGMDKAEIKKSIHSQVLTVFFLPLVTAFIHLAFAFPIITKLLALLNLTHISIFVTGLLCTAAVFTLVYALVYALTAKAYYRIVSD